MFFSGESHDLSRRGVCPPPYPPPLTPYPPPSVKEASSITNPGKQNKGAAMDLLLLGSYTRLSCTIIKLP